MERLLAVPEFQQHLKSARGKDEAFAAGFLPSRNGMRLLARALRSPTPVSDPDVCWAGKTVFRTALTLPQAERSIFVRTFERN
jgi:hypothetical protein